MYTILTSITLQLVSALLGLTAALQSTILTLEATQGTIATTTIQAITTTPDNEPEQPVVFDVPFFSQFYDISSPTWRKVGCGVASLAMLIDFYEPNNVSVDVLLSEGIAEGAYAAGAGWVHSGLARLADEHGLWGMNYDLSSSNMQIAFAQFENALKNGPVMASVHYTFDPKNPIPHLVVMTGEDGDMLFYNDPAGTSDGGSISKDAFKLAWKKRYIEVRPI